MSSPKHELAAKTTTEDVDDPMQGSGEEGEGEDLRRVDIMDDSSEEEDEDEEEARRVTEGFIVDEDEEEDEEDEGPKKRRKRRKGHHRREEILEEDDLELVEENTRGVFRKNNRLSRLRHRSHSPASKRRTVVESSDDDLDSGQSPTVDISKIWDDDHRRGDEDDEDIDDFIEYSDEEAGPMNEAAREARREEKRLQMRRKRAQVRPELVGIDANAWDELHEVFGDGHEYDWALGDDEMDHEEEQYKPEMKYQDVFEPSEIKKRKLTEDDDLIRAMDTPERMQLATSSLSENSTLSLHTQLTEEDIGGTAMWVSQRLLQTTKEKYFAQDGVYRHLSGALVMAVTFVLRQLFIEEYEVPYIWTHKRDYLTYFGPQDERVDLLDLEELWLIYSLGQKYRSLLERRRALTSLYQRLQVSDTYYDEEIEPHLDNVDVVADATEWLSLKYKDKKEDPTAEFRFHDDEEREVEKKRKMPSRVSAYEVAKKSIVVKLVEKFGLQSHQIVQNFNAGRHLHFVDDVDVNPVACAEQYLDPDPIKAQTPEDLLKKARFILSTELGKDPLLRHHIRTVFREEARITVEPTERGIYKIEESHPYFSFKYLLQRPITNMLGSSQFLHIIEAEKENLVTVSLTIPSDVTVDLERKLTDAFSSDHFTEAAKAWNVERSLVIQETLEQHLIPAGVKWIREVLRDEAEELVATICGKTLRMRIDQRPYSPRELKPGESACSVLAVSWGQGDPHKDAITLVYLDEAGRLRDHTKIDNLYDQDNLDEFLFLLDRRKPDVAVIGGFSIATIKLRQRMKEVLRGTPGSGADSHGWGSNSKAFDIPVIYVHDDVARIYQHSKRAAQEFSALSPPAKYCVGLARYVQSPLNEFAALGPDITAISFDENQNLVPKDKIFFALEQALIDVTNKTGVEINRAVTSPYYQLLLPFVCGLGPRKAEVLIKKIVTQGGVLLNRDQFIKGGLLTTKIFLNAAGFLRITQQGGASKGSRNHQHEDAPDPLDDTRIHPEDYELARKMAMDALELDEEDIHNEHPSHVVTLLMQDNDKKKKLDELNLDEFATSLYEANNDQKRIMLNVIRSELISPFADKRADFSLPSNQEILTMLTGETTKTFGVGLIVSALVYRIQRDRIFVRLDSGIEGSITVDQLSDEARNAFDIVKKGQAITAIVTIMSLKLAEDDLYEIELSTRAKHMLLGDAMFRRGGAKPDFHNYWDGDRLKKDDEMLQRKKRAETERSRRVIKHPNFHNFNSADAEVYLEKQQRGDVVIRPSSKGPNHLAVTWKVDDKSYQHIDVTELNNNDPTGSTVGGTLIVDAKHRYSDLDELIVNHVQAMARRVEELMAHEKFKHGPEDDLHLFLKNYVTANPSKSMYGFTLNRKRPGHFNLCFLANKNSTVQTWPVRVTPEAYYLFDAPAVGVPELCDAFKVRHLHESQNYASAASGRTPFGAGMRTPGRPGGATPGHMSVRQVGRTPNPYAGGQTPFVPPNLPPSNYGIPQPPIYQYPPPHPYPGPPPPMPPSTNPPVWGQPSGNW